MIKPRAKQSCLWQRAVHPWLLPAHRMYMLCQSDANIQAACLSTACAIRFVNGWCRASFYESNNTPIQTLLNQLFTDSLESQQYQSWTKCNMTSKKIGFFRRFCKPRRISICMWWWRFFVFDCCLYEYWLWCVHYFTNMQKRTHLDDWSSPRKMSQKLHLHRTK